MGAGFGVGPAGGVGVAGGARVGVGPAGGVGVGIGGGFAEFGVVGECGAEGGGAVHGVVAVEVVVSAEEGLSGGVHEGFLVVVALGAEGGGVVVGGCGSDVGGGEVGREGPGGRGVGVSGLEAAPVSAHAFEEFSDLGDDFAEFDLSEALGVGDAVDDGVDGVDGAFEFVEVVLVFGDSGGAEDLAEGDEFGPEALEVLEDGGVEEAFSAELAFDVFGVLEESAVVPLLFFADPVVEDGAFLGGGVVGSVGEEELEFHAVDVEPEFGVDAAVGLVGGVEA